MHIEIIFLSLYLLSLRTQYHIHCFHPQIVFGFEFAKDVVRLFLAFSELQQISERDYEYGHNEHAPQTRQYGHDSAEVADRVEVSVAYGCDCDYDAPDAIAQVIEVLVGYGYHRSFEHAETIPTNH